MNRIRMIGGLLPVPTAVFAALLPALVIAQENLLSNPNSLEAVIAEIVKPHLLGAQEVKTGSRPAEKKGADKKPPQAWAIVVGVVSQGGKHVFGFGRMSEKSNELPNEQSVFELGGVTKTFTALLLADLVVRDKLKLDDPVHTFLPESVVVPVRGEKQITLEHLATHTSALPPLPASVSFKVFFRSNPYQGYKVDDLYKTLARTELDADPGERYRYSNLAFGLLGHALSREANMEFEELVVKRICEPLGLRDTRVTLSAAQSKRLAPPHTVAGAPSSNWDVGVFAGSGGLRSTAQDMIGYLEANMGLKKTPLLPAMQLCHEARHKAARGGQSIGLGWNVQGLSQRTRLIYHGGGTGGYISMACIMETDSKPTLGLVVLTNAAEDGDVANDVALKLLGALHTNGN